MKKLVMCILTLGMMVSVCGCGAKINSNRVSLDNSDVSQKKVVEGSDLNNSGETAEDTSPNETETPEGADSDTSNKKIDLDLSQLSSTMVYSEVYNMMTDPESYMGKTVRMNGNFAVYQDEATGNIYYACIIADATACCSQGIEFVLSGDYSYPDDYPEVGTVITVTGTFGTYEENGLMYCQLTEAEMSS